MTKFKYKKLILLLILFCILESYLYLPKLDRESLTLSNIQKNNIYQYYDRYGTPLNFTNKNNLNFINNLPLNKFPKLLQSGIIESEDKRFYSHTGIDILAKSKALYQNILKLRVVRGGSTISEQSIRIIKPRPRSLSSKVKESYESIYLENLNSKDDILEFYLNQVPLGKNSRGFENASRLYFGRSLSTLNELEILSLIVLTRAPNKLIEEFQSAQPKKSKLYINAILLADKIYRRNIINLETFTNIKEQELALGDKFSQELAYAPQFLQKAHLLNSAAKYPSDNTNIRTHSKIQNIKMTTLDGILQSKVIRILDGRLEELKDYNVTNGAALVINHQTGEILSWANPSRNLEFSYDTVLIPRQAGSTLKPFLYALAMDQGLRASTSIKDEPLKIRLYTGMHEYNNFSNLYYGNVTAREALGNSLNIPAIKLAKALTPEFLLQTLKKLNLNHLEEDADIYGEGLAIGNGSVTLLELVAAYSTLANHGKNISLKFFSSEKMNSSDLINSDYNSTLNSTFNPKNNQIFSEESASIVTDILSDPLARDLEFGNTSILNTPYRTAVKTGTSSAFRDAWAIGYSSKYTVGVWLGNLDNSPMKQIAGSLGPALALRSIFNEINKIDPISKPELKGSLTKATVCKEDESSERTECTLIDELYSTTNMPSRDNQEKDNNALINKLKSGEENNSKVIITFPTPGLKFAIDPKVPMDYQKIKFKIKPTSLSYNFEWFLDDQIIHNGSETELLYPAERGKHCLKVQPKIETSPLKNSNTPSASTICYEVK